MKTIQEINGSPTITRVSEDIADIIFNMTGFNYGIHEEKKINGTLTLTFDSPQDAQKFVTLYNSI